MFETSFFMAVKAIIYNIIIPLIPWILFIWIFFNKKFNWLILYIIWRFVWIWIISSSVFNLQFFHHSVGIWEFIFISVILWIIFLYKIFYKKEQIIIYIKTLQLTVNIKEIANSFHNISKIEKKFTILGWIFISIFSLVSFLHTINLPTYWYDSFFNRNQSTINIIQDGGVKLFWWKYEILGRWRIGYPIHIPIYKAVISDFLGGYNDIYIDIRQRLIFMLIIIFSIIFTWKKTKNIFYSILPAILITWLPLIFFHSIDGYMDLASAGYSILVIRWIYEYTISWYKKYWFILLAIVFSGILVNIKNDWIIVYLPWIIISFIIFLIFNRKLLVFLRQTIKRINLAWILSSILFFHIPFIIVKIHNWLWFNQAAMKDFAWLEVFSWTVHREIFNIFPMIFLQMDNYNVILIIIGIILYIWFKKTKKENLLLIIVPVFIFFIFMLVFLLTQNYRFVKNQITVNRIFTMTFVILLFFSWILLDIRWKQSKIYSR